MTHNRSRCLIGVVLILIALTNSRYAYAGPKLPRFGRIIARSAPLKAAPSKSASAILSVGNGDLVAAALDRGGYYKVVTEYYYTSHPKDHITGWVSKSAVRLMTAREEAAFFARLRKSANQQAKAVATRTGAGAVDSRSRSREHLSGNAYGDTGGGHWIKDVGSDGTILTLEDGSLWKVDPVDTADTAIWLATDDVVVIDSDDLQFPYKIVNKDEQGEIAHAQYLGSE